MEDEIPREVLYAIIIAAMCEDDSEFYDAGPLWYDELDEK